MAKEKVYQCVKCKRIFKKNYYPTRLVIKRYGIGKYKQYEPLASFDLCSKCYRPIEKYLEGLENEKEHVPKEK